MNYRNKNYIKKTNKFLLIFSIIILSLIINTKYIRAEENKVIKVGYNVVDGFMEVEDGIYSGYAYEYLREIAKHTGWEYEFIEMSINDLIYKLKDGEIDIAGGMLKNEQTKDLYNFPEYNSGYTYTTLSTLKDNENISQSNYYTLNRIKVGYFETAKKSLNNFVEFCEKNAIDNVELVPYTLEDGTELVQALKSKEVDAIIGGDLLINGEQKVISRFGSTPYYFATTKGNTEITKELNEALYKIKENNANFDEKLYNKYFQKHSDSFIVLTEEEQEYISNIKPLKVVYTSNYIPLSNYNNITQKPEGIFIDIINLIAEKSGLSFELVKAKNYEEAYQMIKNKEADLIVGVPSDYLIADENDFVLTESFMKIDLVNVFNKKQQTQQDKKIIALPKGFAHANVNYEDYEIKYYDTLEDCLIAVRDGKANLTYGNIHTISNYMAAEYYANLSVLLDKELGATIGVVRPADKNLLSIINKAVYNLSEEEINNIIYENTINISHTVTLKQFFFDNLIFSMIVIIFILGIIFSLIYIIVRMKFKHLTVLLEKSQIDSLTGIYNRKTFESLFETYVDKKSSELYGAFIITDIDHFKQVNDNLGHKAGDEVLKEFALILKQVFSEKDIISRWGGDEFIVLMTDINENNLDTVNKKLKEICGLMDREVGDNKCKCKISLSVGAVITKEEFDLEKLYQKADEMLYEVKRNGRNGFKIKETL